MCDVRKSVVRLVVMGLAAGMFSGALATANAQKNKKQQHARRETNASREARIQRTINYTYSHRWEVFGGGGYLRFRTGDFLKKSNEVSWATAANYYLNPKFAIVGDARGSFGNAHPLLNNGNLQSQAPNPQINEYTFMGGASHRFYAKEKVASQRGRARRRGLGHLQRRRQGTDWSRSRYLAGRLQACLLGRPQRGL